SYGDAVVPLAGTLQNEIGPDSVFFRTCHVDPVIPGAQEIEMVAPGAEHRIGSEPGGNDPGLSNAEVVAFGNEIEIIRHRFTDGLIQSQRRRNLGSTGGCKIQNDSRNPAYLSKHTHAAIPHEIQLFAIG